MKNSFFLIIILPIILLLLGSSPSSAGVVDEYYADKFRDWGIKAEATNSLDSDNFNSSKSDWLVIYGNSITDSSEQFIHSNDYNSIVIICHQEIEIESIKCDYDTVEEGENISTESITLGNDIKIAINTSRPVKIFVPEKFLASPEHVGHVSSFLQSYYKSATSHYQPTDLINRLLQPITKVPDINKDLSISVLSLTILLAPIAYAISIIRRSGMKASFKIFLKNLLTIATLKHILNPLALFLFILGFLLYYFKIREFINLSPSINGIIGADDNLAAIMIIEIFIVALITSLALIYLFFIFIPIIRWLKASISNSIKPGSQIVNSSAIITFALTALLISISILSKERIIITAGIFAVVAIFFIFYTGGINSNLTANESEKNFPIYPGILAALTIFLIYFVQPKLPERTVQLIPNSPIVFLPQIVNADRAYSFLAYNFSSRNHRLFLNNFMVYDPNYENITINDIGELSEKQSGEDLLIIIENNYDDIQKLINNDWIRPYLTNSNSAIEEYFYFSSPLQNTKVNMKFEFNCANGLDKSDIQIGYSQKFETPGIKRETVLAFPGCDPAEQTISYEVPYEFSNAASNKLYSLNYSDNNALQSLTLSDSSDGEIIVPAFLVPENADGRRLIEITSDEINSNTINLFLRLPYETSLTFSRDTSSANISSYAEYLLDQELLPPNFMIWSPTTNIINSQRKAL